MLLVDSYMVTPAYLRVLSELTSVAYLDDLNAFDYPVQTRTKISRHSRVLHNHFLCTHIRHLSFQMNRVHFRRMATNNRCYK